MKVPVEATGGLVVQTDTFQNPVFKESIRRIFARAGDPHHLGLASNATFEVPAPTLCGKLTTRRGPHAGSRRELCGLELFSAWLLW